MDIKELTNSNIVEVNGEKWILSKRYKTKVPFQVKLLDTPLQIIERYRPCQEDNLIFPNLNYWSICKSLKKGMKECGYKGYFISVLKLLNGRNLIRQKIRLLTAIFSLHSESLQFDCHKQQYFSMGT